MINTNNDLRETHIIGEETREYIINPHACQALAAYHLLMVGISYAMPPFYFARLRPQLSQLLICLEGDGDIWLDGQWAHCSAGMAYLTPANICHAYRATGGQPWKICWLMYDAQNVERQMIAADHPTLVQVETQELSTIVECLYHECLGRAEENVMHQWTYLLHIYAQRISGQNQFDGRLYRLWKQVDANLAHPWHSQEIAQLADMSSEHLRRLCQQQFGHSPMKHITALRMQRAMALLASDGYSVEAVALRVGYENPFAFSTAFKRHIGIAPSTYRTRRA